jgi:hypothetical protein
VEFVIHYDDDVFEEEALGLARRLFAHFDEAIDALTLIPVCEPEFDLFVDGVRVHSYLESGRAPRLSDALRRPAAG